MNETIYQFKANNIQGEEIPLDKYKGKVLLIINTASKCGFTPQLKNMKELHDEFKGSDFEILAFPTNDFAGQEPLEGEELQQFCVLKYEAEYPIFEKIHVKGKNAHPLYEFLSDKKKNGRISSKPKWNFHKYLIDKNGKVVDYFLTITNPNSNKVKKKIRQLLEA